jgi:hypothetical protein
MAGDPSLMQQFCSTDRTDNAEWMEWTRSSAGFVEWLPDLIIIGMVGPVIVLFINSVYIVSMLRSYSGFCLYTAVTGSTTPSSNTEYNDEYSKRKYNAVIPYDKVSSKVLRVVWSSLWLCAAWLWSRNVMHPWLVAITIFSTVLLMWCDHEFISAQFSQENAHKVEITDLHKYKAAKERIRTFHTVLTFIFKMFLLSILLMLYLSCKTVDAITRKTLDMSPDNEQIIAGVLWGLSEIWFVYLRCESLV